MGSLLGIMGRAAWIIGLLCYSVIGQLDWPVNLNHENIALKFEDYVPYVAEDTVYCDGEHIHKTEPCLGDCGFDYVHTANMTCVYIAHSAICDGEYIHASEECAGTVTGCGRTAKLSDGECEENFCNVRNKCQNKLDVVRCDGEYIREEDECPGSCSEEYGYLPRSNNRCMRRDAAVLCGGDFIYYSEECIEDCGDDAYVRTSDNLCMHVEMTVLCGEEYINLLSPKCHDMCKPEE